MKCGRLGELKWLISPKIISFLGDVGEWGLAAKERRENGGRERGEWEAE
jgi:hypothetical protein